MALFRRFFYRKPPDRLLEISERVYVFDCCFSIDVLDEDEYRTYINGIVAQLQDHYPDAAFMVFNFKEGDTRSQLSNILSKYGMTVMDYPQKYEGCPLLPLEMIHHFLRSSESWLSVEGQQNVLLMHCERGGWPVLAFMLAGLLLYRKQYTGEMKTLDMVYKQAPREVLQLLTPLNPQPSHLRYLQYISRRNFRLDWPSSDSPLTLDCVILRVLPLYDGGRGCRPIVRVYGQDPSSKTSVTSTKLLFSTAEVKKHIRLYQQEECELVKMDIHRLVQGDVYLECVHLEEDLVREETIFRIMFHTQFVRSNVLLLTRDEVDVLWDAKDQISREFRVEVLFSDGDYFPSVLTAGAASDDDSETDVASPDEFFEAEEIFSNVLDGQDIKGEFDNHTVQDSSQDDEVNLEISWKDDSEHHAFQDCASDEAGQKHLRKVEHNSIFLLNGEVELDSSPSIAEVDSNDRTKYENTGKFDEFGEAANMQIQEVATSMKSEKQSFVADNTNDNKQSINLVRNGEVQLDSSSVIADVDSYNGTKYKVSSKYEKSAEAEYKQNQEVVVSMKSQKQGSQQNNTPADDNNNSTNKQKLDKKKQPVSRSKSASEAFGNKKGKLHENHLARQAKASAVSRWIPSNIGSYTNSMHVYYPPSRHNSAPAVLALGKDSPRWGKSKLKSVTTASEVRATAGRSSISGRGKLASSPSLLDLSLAEDVSSPASPSNQEVELYSEELSPELRPDSPSTPHNPSPPPPPPPPPPHPPPPPLPPSTGEYLFNEGTSPLTEIFQSIELNLPPPPCVSSAN
ncbi:hypothetical protein MIMGU_mgv1a025175mg, partial [Erythranthe guttata]